MTTARIAPAVLVDLVRSYVRTTCHARDAAPRCETIRRALAGLGEAEATAIREEIGQAVRDGIVADPGPFRALVGGAAGGGRAGENRACACERVRGGCDRQEGPMGWRSGALN